MSEIKNPNLPMTDEEIDELLERFDQTEPAFQRKIVAMFMSNAVYFQMVATELLFACKEVIAACDSGNPQDFIRNVSDAAVLCREAVAKAEGKTR